MTRAFALLVLYVALGTVVTLVGYRLVWGGPLAPAGSERSLDGLVTFLGIALNTALAFAATGVIAALIARSHTPFGTILLVSMVAAGAIGTAMMFWFAGLTLAYPLFMAASGAVCAAAAKLFGFLVTNGAGVQP